MRKVLIKVFLFLISSPIFSQNSIYKINKWADGPITVAGAVSSYFGLRYLNNKPHLDSAFVASLKPEDVNAFDRGATRTNRHPRLKTYANIFMYSSFAAPFFLAFDKKIKSDALKVGLLYLETMTIAANAYTWGVGSFHRVRPYIYNPNIPIDKKLGKKTTDSFFAGHPFATAAATFFVAKVFHDYNPESKLRKYIWATAVAFPVTVAYFRYKNGDHFPTDIMVGIPLGAAIGILVPHLHKINNNTHVRIYPAPGGMGMTYSF